jgi:hypothetical protein
VILRILAQESLDLELWLKRYEFLKFWSYFCGFSEARDRFVNFFQTQGVRLKNYGLRVNFGKPEGLLCKIPEITGRSGARELLTSDGRVEEMWRTEGNDRWRLELVARAKEGAKGLEKEGMRCGESRGSHRPFIGAGGAPERGGRGSNDGVNGVNANEGGGEVKTGD